MTKNDILAYVTETPTNTNRAVLSHMLDSFESGDNKQEIELLAQENKVYTPAEGKVYNKVTVNVPAPVSDWTSATVTVIANTEGGGLDNNYLVLPAIADDALNTISSYNGGTFTVPLYKGATTGWTYKGVESVTGDCTVSNHDIVITGDCTISFNA